MTPRSMKVAKIIKNNENFRTYIFKQRINAKAGQFVMVWMPEVDEIPISIAWRNDEEFAIGIAKVGDCTKAIFEKIKEGDLLGIRGPYGTSFNLKEYKNIALIGGGSGTVPILNLAHEAKKKGIETSVFLGARSKDLLLYEDNFEKLNVKLKIATSDGSKGFKGYNTTILESEMLKTKFDCLFTCGPELMMYKIATLAKENNIESQLSLERFMKCGFGICGQCCMDKTGFRVCKDGPIASGEIALEMEEFAKYKRDSSGIKHNF